MTESIGWQDIRLHAGEGKLSAQTVLDAANTALRNRDAALLEYVSRLEAAAIECADELEAEVKDRWGYDERLSHKLERDMAPVAEVRAALSSKPERMGG
jgi:hypothetical protein